MLKITRIVVIVITAVANLPMLIMGVVGSFVPDGPTILLAWTIIGKIYFIFTNIYHFSPF